MLSSGATATGSQEQGAVSGPAQRAQANVLWGRKKHVEAHRLPNTCADDPAHCTIKHALAISGFQPEAAMA